MKLLPQNPPIDHDRVVAAIAAAERRTSGEVRVVVSRVPAPDPIKAAQAQFERLGMTQTAARNGVLIFLCPRSHTFAVIGDRGIHDKCGAAFWQDLAGAMSARFRRGDFTDGLVLGIERAGALLGEHFPRARADQNELPDKVEEV
ncbi:MAG: TPM domain-containing protein [Opitutaceae bacterium]|nr:TPM domain-containing protein [Opitutaceae bacterium]